MQPCLRFGKFIELRFEKNGCLVGGFIHTYLLEKVGSELMESLILLGLYLFVGLASGRLTLSMQPHVTVARFEWCPRVPENAVSTLSTSCVMGQQKRCGKCKIAFVSPFFLSTSYGPSF